MSLRGQVFIVSVSVLVILYVLNALRKRKINEEYCLWWIFIMVATDVLVLWPRLLLKITHSIGALVPISTLTLFALILMLAILVYFSMKISVLTNQVKELIQSAALQKKDYDDLRLKLHEENSGHSPDGPNSLK
jgi:hypothetical protein